jgi:hypothetical protein
LVPGDARGKYYVGGRRLLYLDAKPPKRRAPRPATPSDFLEGA